MKRCFRWAVTLALLWCASACMWRLPANGAEHRGRGCCKSRYQRDSYATRSTEALGREYQRLQRKRCEACTENGSDLVDIMRVLANRLNGTRREDIERIMGKPDRVREGTFVYYWVLLNK